VALKLVGLALGMLALSGVGMASMLGGATGVQVPLAGMLGADIHAAWLANPSAPATHPAPSGTNALLARADLGSSAAGSAHALAHAGEPETSVRLAENANAGAANAPVPPPPNGSTGMTDDGRVILNLAGVDDLRRLPGVGQKRAEAILALRTRLGRFKQVSDLLRVKGIGVRGLKKIMPKAVVDAPKPAA
jgi:competence protein ComEA